MIQRSDCSSTANVKNTPGTRQSLVAGHTEGVVVAHMPLKKHAIVALPLAGRDGDLPPFPLRRQRWLARSQVSNARGEILSQVLSILALPTPKEGFGALRLWGQTGAPPDGWVAAADPVFLEARLNHVVLHRLDEASVDDAEVASLFAHLRQHLAENGDEGFSSIGKLGYVHRRHPMEVAQASPAVAEGNHPEDFLPTGDRSKTHARLQSEVQMCLHESVVNQRRAVAGKPPVTGLWMWGGGVAPALPKVPLPPLFADEPLCRGYWHASSAAVADWAGDLEACLASSPDGFVAVLPASAADNGNAIDAHLESLRRMLRRGRLRAVTLLPGRGFRLDIRRWDALRLWRRKFTLPGEEHGG